MIRALVIRVCLFALPFALYLIYRMMPQASGAAPGRHPWMPLAIAGLVLVALSFLAWGLFEGDPAGGLYVPPHVVGGKVVPGHVETKP